MSAYDRMFAYEMHRLRHAELAAEAARDRQLRAARTARRTAGRAAARSAGRESGGQVRRQPHRSWFGRTA
ncbi:hypothetical protein [Streptomyces physcomitrii]|uniref:Uncharacterized protein n=1 Tax=Streptomyces physcomitrii TaxID=2724184 RepID=A0ABX1HC68_9ACTN|nr:hypothetical protein [Streptomyces physcomitrii]NKI44804.1 hypothetical protein [Streptomyces physcomitrii]